MKNKILILSLGIGINLFALDINQAVDFALKNNYSLKQQQYIVDESKTSLDLSKTAYHPKLDLNYNYNNRDKKIIGQIDEDSGFNATLSYNLFNGFSDKYHIVASKNLLNYKKLTLDAFKEDFILNVKNIYITYLLKQKNTQTLHEALKLYKKQYFDTKNYFDQGLIAQNDLLEVEVVMLQSKQNYQNAKSDQKIAKKRLENILVITLNENENINELNENRQTAINFDNKKLNNRSEVKALEQLKENYTNIAYAIKGNFYPKINATLTYNKYGDDIFPDGRTNYPKNQTVGAITLKWNLYNGEKDKLSIVVYNQKINQIKMQIEDLKLQIKLQYEQAKEVLYVAKLNLKTAIKARKQAEVNYIIVKNKVKEGISTNSDLIDANYLLKKSKQNYFMAFYNQYLAIATLQRILEEGITKELAKL